MSVQSEAQLEHELIAQLKNLGYSQVDIKDETQLLSNLKIQVERANDISAFSANEWAQVLGFGLKHRLATRHRSFVGAGLLAMASARFN